MAYVTLPTFVGFTTRSGPKRATFAQNARRLYENPEKGAFDFYLRAVNAIRAGRAKDADETAMASLVDQANIKSRAHFAAVSEGWLAYLGRRRPELVDVGRSRWGYGAFEIGISPHLAIKRGGQVYVVWLYLKAEPLNQDGANAALWLMNEVMDDLAPGAKPMVIDVRRSKEYHLSERDRLRIGRWVRSEASSFLTLWDAAA
ncbi:hypothetical protein [Amycolatopsis nalaikhensis]|uniref:Uncharacterized protein n=1 Tax=Amycolatopsis nalaikhensis TaxID=715472 RepID=A0ABY8XTU2_9PSEU|nr:hypothetical protein [Amycolatopsis sp. 2-2]WIV59076.1 hypothetical protein QP939_10795 [Amycolatopsis sp. 2-2]